MHVGIYAAPSSPFHINTYLGADPEVIFELLKPRISRDNLWVQINGTNRYHQIGGNEVVQVQNTSVAGWDDRIVFNQRIRNYSGKPIDVEIRRTYPGHAVFRSVLEPTLFDFQTVQFQKRVPAGDKADLLFEVVQHKGYNEKQHNVTLVQSSFSSSALCEGWIN